jgi:GNAT superfamily N-acetyltransferase
MRFVYPVLPNLIKMPSFTTKLATEADIPVIIDLHKSTWEPTYKEILSPEQIAYMSDKFYSVYALEISMSESFHQFLILLNGDIPCGFASVSLESPNHFKLQKIYVLHSCQGTGAGKYLITEVEKFVREKGADLISLNVNRYNKAKSFYEKMAYQVIREEDIPVGPYWMNDYVLEKKLS